MDYPKILEEVDEDVSQYLIKYSHRLAQRKEMRPEAALLCMMDVVSATMVRMMRNYVKINPVFLPDNKKFMAQYVALMRQDLAKVQREFEDA